MLVKMSRRSVCLRRLARSTAGLFRDGYFFCEKTSCVARFHVRAGPDGRFPTDQAASLLAMYCMARGQSPCDYAVLVPAEEDELEGLYEKANKLLQVGQSVHSQVKLTRREEQVLNGLTRDLANKEIAVALNLSERTVKFHVSSLLAKFNVRRRTELARRMLHAWSLANAQSGCPANSPTHFGNCSELHQRAADQWIGSCGQAPDCGLSLKFGLT